MTCKKINAILFIVITFCTTISWANTVDDVAITTEVKLALAQEKDIPAGNIEVTTVNNVVSLRGVVDTRLQADKIVEIASSIDRVTDVVDSELRVKESHSAISDSLITAKIKGKIRHLYMHKKIAEGYDLHVETTNHTVHIFGEVATAKDIDTIIAAAQKVKHVKAVKTNIRVRNK